MKILKHLVDHLVRQSDSTTPATVGEVQKSEERIPDSALSRVEQAVETWKESGGHLQTGLSLPRAAETIGVPRYLLSAWLKQRGEHYSDWLTALRIGEAILVLRTHPDWSNETVARHCGFSDRTYFQRKFKQITGLTPSNFQEQHA